MGGRTLRKRRNVGFNYGLIFYMSYKETTIKNILLNLLSILVAV